MDQQLDKQLLVIGQMIADYLKSGGKLTDSKLPFDIAIKSYVTRKNREVRLKYKDNPELLQQHLFSKDKVYVLLGYQPVAKHQKLTFDRVYAEICEYVKNGGKFDKQNVKEYPFYNSVKHFLESENKKGVKISYPQFMSLCGFYPSQFEGLDALLSKYADSNNCIDKIRGTADYNTLKSKADTFGCSPAEYLTLFTKYHFTKSVIPVSNYIKVLKRDLAIVLKGKTDASGLEKLNPQLYMRVKHLREYFPEGTLPEVADAFEALGYSYDGHPIKKAIINEQYLLKKLEAMFPDKQVKNLDHTQPITKQILKLSLKNDQTMYDYLLGKGFTYVTTKKTPRLTSQTDYGEKLQLLQDILEQKGREYNQQKMCLKYEVATRTFRDGRIVKKGSVISSDCIIYMPTVYDMDLSKKQVAQSALTEFHSKHM